MLNNENYAPMKPPENNNCQSGNLTTEVNVFNFSAKTQREEEKALINEIREFENFPALLNDRQNRWYLAMIARDAPKQHLRTRALNMLAAF